MSNDNSAEKIVMHTPGPWEVDTSQTTDEHPHYFYVNGEGNGDFICHDAHGTRFAMSGHIGLANAKLCAAAPDLLAALKECEQTLARAITGEPTLAGCALSQARAAIEKATT